MPTEIETLVDLSVTDVAAALDRHPRTIRELCRTGAIRGYKLRGKEWRVRPAELRRFLDEEERRHYERLLEHAENGG